MPIDNRPEDSLWGSNYAQVNPTGEKHSWKRQTGKNQTGKNQTAKNQTGRNQPTFIRHPARLTIAFLVETWKRLEARWEANPGFFAATVTGSVGLLLIAAMLFNAGVSWLQDDPVGDDVAVDSPESITADATEAELGDADGDEFIVMRGRNKKLFLEDEDDPGIDSDPFAETRPRDNSITNIIREDPAEEEPDDSTEMATPVEIAKVQTPQRPGSLDEDEVASQPQLKTVEMDDEEDEEKVATAEADPWAETESDPAPAEPARLKPQSQVDIAQTKEESSPEKPIEPAQPIENDDQADEAPLKPNRSIDLVRGPVEKAVPQNDPRWQQQRTKSSAEKPAPAVAARQSRPVETRIFAPSPSQSTPSQSTPAAKTIQPARSKPAIQESRTLRTQPSATPLRLAMSAPPAVRIGQPCQIEIRVTNTGSLPAHHLVVSAELPEGLVHDVAQSLEQQIDTLAPGATYRALLRLRGRAVGEKTIQVEVGQVEVGQGEVGQGDQATVRMSAKVRVVSISETATTIGSDDYICEPLVR